MPKENDDSSMFIEIVQRLTKIEANTEGLSEISSIARKLRVAAASTTSCGVRCSRFSH